MRLTEQDSRAFLMKLGVHLPEALFLPFETDAFPSSITWEGPMYVKAQVSSGRRGMRGLVRRCETSREVQTVIREMKTNLSEGICAGFLGVPEVVHTQEWFFSVSLAAETGRFRCSIGEQGGGGVAQVSSYDLDQSDFPQAFLPLARACAQAMLEWDALLIEMNPFVHQADGTWTALDAKVELDEAAAFRHPEWKDLSPLSRWGEGRTPREQAYLALRQQNPLLAPLGTYVELEGDIAVLLSGGGASLVALDALIQAGGRPANYLELSGNPDPLFLEQAMKIVLMHPRLRAVWIAGSYANFTDLQITIRAMLKAIADSGLLLPVFIRRDGPMSEAAQEESMAWAEKYHVKLVFLRADYSLSEAAAALVEEIK